MAESSSSPLPDRQSVRLRGFDYSLPYDYFVTICTDARRCCLGRIEDDRIVLSEIGRVVEECWIAIPSHCERASLGAHVVMPNHVHGIVKLRGRPPGWQLQGRSEQPPARSEFGAVTPGSLATVVGSFKAAATRFARRLLANPEFSLWQRGYYDHVIRSDRAGGAIDAYIRDNPRRWRRDRENPDGDGSDDVEAFVRALERDEEPLESE